jgi:hypothetical protein
MLKKRCSKSSFLITALRCWPVIAGSGLSVLFPPSSRTSAQSVPDSIIGPMGVIEGVVIDEWGATLPGFNVQIVPAMRPVPFSRWAQSDDSGHFRISVDPGGYKLGGEIMVGDAYLSPKCCKTVFVQSGDTVHVVLDSREGNGLAIRNVRIDGVPGSATLKAGEEFQLEFDYWIWSPKTVPETDQQIVIGIEEEGLSVINIGRPYPFPGLSGHEKRQLTAPVEAGTYRILGLQVLLSSTDADLLRAEYEKIALSNYVGPIFIQSIHVK